MKKFFYIFMFYILCALFSQVNIEAIEYCNLFLNNELIETVELPFFLYKNSVTYTITDFSLPIISTSSDYTIIDSSTRCNCINKNIENNNENPIANKTYYDYTKEKYKKLPDYNEVHLSKINKNGILKGFSSYEDIEPPYFSGYKEKYTTNINNPIDLKLILNQITAYDERDGNLTNKINIEFNSYDNNKDKLGTYTVMLNVIDSSNNKASITFYIEIIDNTPPIIEGKDEYDSYLSNILTLQTIQSNLTVKDNVYKNMESQLYVCEDNYSVNKKKLGTYTVFFCVYDLSNNLSSPFKVTINVKNDIKPIIEGANYYTSKLSNPLTITEIMYSLAASSNGKDISSSIYVQKDNYSNFLNTLGEKTIYFQAMDESNNISDPFKVTVNLIDDISPQIFGLDTYNSYLSNPLSLTYLKQQLTVLDNYDGNITHKLEIIDDSYTTNINKLGTYYIFFQASDSSSNVSEIFKIKITNIDDIPPTIIGPSSLSYLLKDKPSINNILLEYKVKDNIDLDLEILIGDDNTYNEKVELGTYYLSLYSVDKSNNRSAPLKIKIDIVDKLLNLNELTLYLPTSNLLTIEEISTLVNINEEYILIEDTYTPNYYAIGSYTITYELTDSTIIKLIVKTYNEMISIKEVNKEETKTILKKETFFSKIKSFFLKIISFFKNLLNFINIYLLLK